MESTVNTNIRIPLILQQELKHVAQLLQQPEHWIITQALQAYLQKYQQTQTTLEIEAKQQCLLANQTDKQITEDWESLGMETWSGA
jgi:predicted DNA-binding protein